MTGKRGTVTGTGCAGEDLVVLTAMDEEAVALREMLERHSERDVGGVGIASGLLEGTRVHLVSSGIGKVAAAAATTVAILQLEPGLLVVVGLAGGLSAGAEPGTLVAVTEAAQHDFDLRPLLPRRGLLPNSGSVTLAAHRVAVGSLERSCGSVLSGAPAAGAPGGAASDGHVMRGGVLSGDQIVADEAVKAALVEEFPGAACVDMETAAVAQVAAAHGVPWCAVRLVSDFADDSFDATAVLGYCAEVGARLMAEVVADFAANWSAACAAVRGQTTG